MIRSKYFTAIAASIEQIRRTVQPQSTLVCKDGDFYVLCIPRQAAGLKMKLSVLPNGLIMAARGVSEYEIRNMELTLGQIGRPK